MLRPIASGESHTGYIWLLVSLLVLLLAGAFFEADQTSRAMNNLLLGLTLAASVYPLRANRMFVVYGGALALIAFAALWLGLLTDAFAAKAIGLAAGFVFFLSTAVTILITVLLKPRITTDELAGAVSVYLLLGISGAFVFALIELGLPGSLINTSNPIASAERSFGEYLYFSFTCLTTLGFGDVVPAGAQARVFAYLEAVIGQVYLTVLVARLVGLHLTQTRD